MNYNHINADVLIIGCGTSGANAAIAAAEKGAKVVTMDKGKIERSGASGTGQAHFLGFAHQRGSWDSAEGFLAKTLETSKGAVDLSLVEAVVCSEMDEAVKRLDRLGLLLRWPDGTYWRLHRFGIYLDGRQFKPKLAKEIRRLGCTVLDKTMTTDLVLKNGMVVGAIGFNIRSGELYFIEAKATIVSAGLTNRLYRNPWNNPFNTYNNPSCTGDGMVAALNAGATLANMEFTHRTIVPKGFSTTGASSLNSQGARFMNSLGEYYMESHPQGNRARRYDYILASLKELQEGRGPIYFDCRSLNQSQVDKLIESLSHDRSAWSDYIKQRGIDLTQEPLEIAISEGIQKGPSEFTGAGIKIDKNCASEIPGLFAAGDNANCSNAFHGAFCSGSHAGKAAANYAFKIPSVEVNTPQVEEKLKAIKAPLERTRGLTHQELEYILREIMEEYVGITRTEARLKTGINKIRYLKDNLEKLKAQDYHELMRVHELGSMVTIGEIMAEGALYRKESRFKPYHWRTDFPETDDKNWSGWVLVRNEAGKVFCSFHRLSD